MERLFKPYDKEHMRLAMLKHEETFRKQVYELHRLYRIQKMLMKSTKSDLGDDIGLDQIHHQKQGSRRFKLDLERPADDYIAESVEESEIELTLGLGLGPSNHNPRKEAEIITPLHSDCGPSSFSSSSSGSSHIVNMRSYGTHSAHQLEVEGEQLRQQKLNQPPWLFQVLSLNMT